MAFIAPFRGVRYNPEKISDIRSVVAPPYDVISPEELQDLRSRSPYNVVHIDLPNAEGSSGEDVYTQAGRRFRGWLVEGVLRADERPALYAYHQRYRVPGTDKTLQLTGVIAAVRLARWEEGIILPHEHTFAKPKEDRLRLMRAGEANFSQVYAFYSDPARRADEALAEVTAGRAPDVHTLDDDGASHSVWVVDAPEVVGRVVNALAGTTLYIADGHHRYETALDYRDERRAEVGVDARAGHEYVMMMLVNADGGGLTVLPTHRMVMLPAGLDRARVEERLRRYFHVTPFEGSEPTRTAEEAAAAIAGDQTSMTLLAGRQGWTLRPRPRRAPRRHRRAGIRRLEAARCNDTPSGRAGAMFRDVGGAPRGRAVHYLHAGRGGGGRGGVQRSLRLGLHSECAGTGSDYGGRPGGRRDAA